MIECAEKNIILWRGSNKFPIDPYNIWDVYPSRISSGRAPMSTSKFLHDLANKTFIEKFGWPVRDGIFTTKDFSVADSYGRAFIFIPVDSYQYAWSPKISDFYMYVTSQTTKLTYFDIGGGDPDAMMYRLWIEKYGPKTIHDNGGEWFDVVKNEIIKMDSYEKKSKVFLSNHKVGDEIVLGVYHKRAERINVFWKPTVDFNQFKKEEWLQLEGEMRSIVNTYTGKVLVAANEKHEILFNCDKYIMIWVPRVESTEKEKILSEYFKILREYK
jgi:hypothetical protein